MNDNLSPCGRSPLHVNVLLHHHHALIYRFHQLEEQMTQFRICACLLAGFCLRLEYLLLNMGHLVLVLYNIMVLSPSTTKKVCFVI